MFPQDWYEAWEEKKSCKAQCLACSRSSMDASPSLSTEITANLQQVIPLESPLLSLSTHLGQWYRPCILLGNPNSILASTAHQWGTSSSQTAGSQVYHWQEKASGTCPPGPPPHSVPAIPVQGHHSAVLQGQKHHGGWGLYWRCPKIEVKLQRGEDGGDLACAVWSRETGSETEMGTGWVPPSQSGWLAIHLPTRGN